MKVGYIRVSTIDQNDARQKEALKNYSIEKYFIEKVSAKDLKRPELLKALEFCREGDTLYVHDFSRLARSTQDLLSISIWKRRQRKLSCLTQELHFWQALWLYQLSLLYFPPVRSLWKMHFRRVLLWYLSRCLKFL